MDTQPKKRGRPKKPAEAVVPIEAQVEPNVPPIAIEAPKTYSISIKLGTQTLVGVGSTGLAAIQALEKPVKIVSKSTLKMEYDGKTTTRNFMPHQLNRIFFSSPRFQEVHAKQLWAGLKGTK